MMTILIGISVLAAIALFAAPSVTYSAAGNILATSTSISGGGTNTSAVVDFSTTSFGGWVAVTSTGGGTVAGTSGLRADFYPSCDSTPNYANNAIQTITVPTVVSSTRRGAIWLGPGKYSVTLTNLDASNAITAGITANTYA
jgi:hypothetical protein